MILEEKYTLSNGIEIPKLGLGTWFIDNDKAAQAVMDAAEIGYRHIDTAQDYGNESGVGDGVRACGVPREQMFVTTKVAAEVKSYDEALSAIDKSLQSLRLDYIDMMIIHSPQPWREFRGEIATSKGTVKHGERSRAHTRQESFAPSGFRTSKSPISKTSWRPARSSRW
jgi:diketogulonate reductase-like aldo/keto reductase